MGVQILDEMLVFVLTWELCREMDGRHLFMYVGFVLTLEQSTARAPGSDFLTASASASPPSVKRTPTNSPGLLGEGGSDTQTLQPRSSSHPWSRSCQDHPDFRGRKVTGSVNRFRHALVGAVNRLEWYFYLEHTTPLPP